LTRIAVVLGIASFVAVAIGLALAAADVISRLQFDLVFAIACGNTVVAFLIKIGIGRFRAVVSALALTGAAVAAQLSDPDILLAPYLAIVLVNGFVAYVFARGLLPGHEPLILQIVRLIGSGCESSRGFRKFVYGQCLIWTCFGLATSLCGLVAMISPSARVTAGMAASGLIVAQICWFVLSHLYANRRYGRPETWQETLRTMSRPAIWTELEI
jgi:hypothetical protein